MKILGRAWCFGDNISTDDIIPGRFFHLRGNIKELARHTFEDLRPDFSKSVRPGDVIVAGENFGIGSSREHAVHVLKVLGISAIIAKSFSRIFFRNAINIGIPAIVANTSGIDEGDKLEINLNKGTVFDITKNLKISFKPIPRFLIDILEAGGLIEYVKKYGPNLVRP